MSKGKNQHAGMSFDQHVQTAVQMAIKGNIKAEVTEATIMVAQETRKALSSMKMRLDALENLFLQGKAVTRDTLKEALWEVQETLFGLTLHDGGAGTGNGIRLRVKEEEIGKETDAEPVTESYAVLGQQEFPKAIEAALLGAKAGETKYAEMDDDKTPLKEGEVAKKYKITLVIDRVYKTKETVDPMQGFPAKAE